MIEESARLQEALVPQLGIRHWQVTNTGERLLYSWYWTAVIVSLILVLAFPVSWYLPDFAAGFFGLIDLRRENNLGAWWSGVLLFMLAAHAYDAGAAARCRTDKIARAWMIISAVFLFLSADETGSIHERLSIISLSSGFGSWGLELIVGGIIGVLLFFALYTFWQGDGECRRYVLPLFIGFAVLGSVAIQEFIEHAVDWGSGPIVWIRGALEEGSELLGMVILLRVILQPNFKIAGRNSRSRQHLFTAFLDHSRFIALLLFALIPVFTIMAVLVTDNRGHLANWIAIITLVSAGLLALGRAVRSNAVSFGRCAFTAALCLIASALPMYFSKIDVVSISGLPVSKTILALAIIYLIICAVWINDLVTQSRNWKTLIALCTVLVIAAPVLGSSTAYVFLAMQVLAVITLWITSVATQKIDHRH